MLRNSEYWLIRSRENVTLSTSNSASLYYFAVEAYAFDIAVPGEGCVGKAKEEHDHGHADDVPATVLESATATATSAAEVTSIAATTTEAAPEATSTAAEAPAEPQGDCHTHDDGVVHCI